MTDFLDVLETQLETAARRRYRRRERPRFLGEIALAATAIAAVFAMIVALGGGGGDQALHSGRTPQANAPGAIGEAARGVDVEIYGGDPAAGKKLASQLSKATGGDAHFTRLRGPYDRHYTEVSWGRDHAAAALAVSEFIGDTPPELAALRVLPGWGEFQTYPVVVWLGPNATVTRPRNPLPVRFQDGCPRHARPLPIEEGPRVLRSLLLSWPRADRAVALWSASRGPGGFDPDALSTRPACGVARATVVGLQLTAGPRAGAQILAAVVREGDHLVVWTTAPASTDPTEPIG